MKKLYLVDVSSLFFRAFFAIPPMRNAEGLPTNALYGLLSMVIKLLKQLNPDYMVFCQDRKEPSFRKDLYSEYKANRDEMPEDLVPQMPYIQKLIDVLGITSINKKGYEADDIIGSLTRLGREKGLEVVIVSGDKDFAQLIQPFVTMYDTMKDINYDVDKVVEKWGVNPKQFKDYLALVGDSSDNIPGIRGVGPKTAQKLLAEYGTLEDIFSNKDKISGKALKTKIETGEDDAYLSRKLVTIVEDLDLGVEIEDLKLKPIDRDHLVDLLNELEFKSFAKKIFNDETKEKKSSTVKPEKKSESIAKKITKKSKSKSKKTELELLTWSAQEIDQGIEPYSQVWGINGERGVYLGLSDKLIEVTGETQEVGEVLSKKLISWKGFDLKEFWKIFALIDPIALWDSKMAAYVCKAGAIGSFSEVYTQYTGHVFPELPTPQQLLECEQDLEKALLKKLETVNGLKVYQDIEIKTIGVLYAMEQKGILLDKEILAEQSKHLTSDIKKIEKNIYKLADSTFNIASPKQLGKVLFEDLGLPPSKKTKTGYSTGSEVLEKLKGEFPICEEVLKFRELSKLKSTYVDSLPLLVKAETGRIHTTFNQALTATGRLSSNNPNLQNIPIRTERGRDIRKAFYASEGSQFISIDYSQIELRVLAHMAEDPGLIKAFQQDRDVHTATAQEVFSVSEEEVTADLRRKAKAVNFGIAYGQGAYGLADTLGISRSEGKEIIERYFEKFPGVKKYMENTVVQAMEKGFVESLFGRRRYIDELKSKSPAVRKFGERAAINAPIQGTSSDIMKLAMIKVFEEVHVPLLLQVHDEILVECPVGDIEYAVEDIKEIMENVVQLNVPLKVNVAVGKNWWEAHA